MTSILTHQGCTGPYITGTKPPQHMLDCIEQYRLFNPGDLFVLTDRNNIQHLPTYDNVHVFALEDFHSPKISRFVSLYNFRANEFWCVTFTRLIYIENFMREQGLRYLCEFANDVLVYFDTNLDTFRQAYTGLAVTPCGPQHTLDGFAYIDNWQALAAMTDFWIALLAKHGVNGICSKYKYDMVNEMTMMHRYGEDVGLEWLPILPFGQYSDHFEEFNALFDPATYGQYVGGTRVNGPGVKATNHYVGHVLNAHPEYDVIWQNEDGLRVPYFSYDGKLARLNSLHIHSKNMRLYMSMSQMSM